MNDFEKLVSRNAEQRRSLDLLTAILDTLPANIALVDPDGVIVATNGAWRGFEVANGYPGGQETLGANYLEVCDRAARDGCDDAAATAAGLRNVLQGRQETFSLEYPCHSPTEQRWFRLMVTRMHSESSQGAVVMHVNVTERRSAQLIVREQAALLDHAHDAIIVRDRNQLIKYWNKSAQRLYGWTAEEALGKDFRVLLKCEERQFNAAMDTVLKMGSWDGRIDKVRKDGMVVKVEGSWTLFSTDLGSEQSVLTIDTDITERNHLEMQFLRAQRMESIGTLAGGIAHDLNNLLLPIIMGVGLLRQLDPSPKSLPILDNIQQSATRGANLVKQVLSFARGVEGTRVEVQVSHIIREIGAIVESTFPKNIRWEDKSDATLWTIVADPTQVHQVLLNICVNARDAMPEGGVITLKAHNVKLDAQYVVMHRGVPPGKYLALEITDNGVGMPRDVMDRIFEPFFTTKGTGGGTGLGLSTVSGIVRSHGGFVNVYSEPGRGSTFKVYLPAEVAKRDRESGAPFEAMPRGNGELLLLVDDEPPILHVTKQTLESYNYRVLTAEDGATAVAIYAKKPTEIDLVITDMMMPIMDGPALIAAIRHINRTARIIATSGLQGNAALARAMNNGIEQFLPKPFTAESLLKTIRDTLLKP